MENNQKIVASGQKIVARTAIMGSCNPQASGWHLVMYVADSDCKSGYRFVSGYSTGMYPNKANYKATREMITDLKSKGYIYCKGRPHAGKNAPVVVSIPS